MAVRAAFPGYFRFLTLVLYRFCPSLWWDFRFCRGPNCPWVYPKDSLCFILSGLGHSPPRLGPLDSPWANGPGPSITWAPQLSLQLSFCKFISLLKPFSSLLTCTISSFSFYFNNFFQKYFFLAF